MNKPFFLILVLAALGCEAYAQSQIEVKHIESDVNTVGNETAPTILDQSTMYYSCLPHPDTSRRGMKFDEPLMQLMQATIGPDGELTDAKALTEGLVNHKEHVGNTAYDIRNQTMYFTRCHDESDGVSICAIYSAKRKGDKWKSIKPLGKEINMPDYTSTQPAIAYMGDSTVVLYFVSDRPGGIGGMDIWYALIVDGKVSAPINLGEPVNSEYDEITPFYHSERNALYFSSDRPGGLGEFDIYASNGMRNSYCPPVAMPSPINTEYDDMDYIVADSNGMRGYLSSNRDEALYATDKYCCNDIFMWKIVPAEDPELSPLLVEETPADSVGEPEQAELSDPIPTPNAPIKLFFHNDEPDPGATITATKANYEQVANEYVAMRKTYKDTWKEHLSGRRLDSVYRVIDDFFTNEVEADNDRLEQFMWVVAEQVWAGHTVTISIRGYASPLNNSTTDYNLKLSQRRINCFVNYLRAWNSGNLRRSIDQGLIRIEQLPYGSTKSSKGVSDRQDDPLHSVYSIEAAKERRIEIVNYVAED